MNNCNSPNSPFNVRIVVPENKVIDFPEYEIKGIPPIKVVKSQQGTKTVWTISYAPSIGPKITASASPSTVEIGIPVEITYTFVETVGSSAIVTRLNTPNDLVNDKKSYTFMAAGTQGVHSRTITDVDGLSATASAGVSVKYRFYKGTIERNSTAISESIISGFTSALGSSIGEAFGRQLYTMDKTQGHFLWIYPADFASIPTPTGDANFPFGLTDVPGLWTINGIQYKAAKTSTYFSNGGTATLGF